MELKARSEINALDTWSLDQVYPEQTQIDVDLDKIKMLSTEINDFQGCLMKSPDHLKNALTKYIEMNQIIEKVYVYHSHLLDQDHQNSENQSMLAQIKALYTDVSPKVSYISPEILQASEEKIIEFTNDKTLQEFKKMLSELLAEKQYVLSLKEEKIMSYASQLTSIAYEVYSTLTNAELKFADVLDENDKSHEFNEGLWSRYSHSADRTLRKNAFNELMTGYGKYNQTLAVLYLSELKARSFATKTRGYKNPRNRALTKNQIDEQIYDNLIKVVNENLDKNHKYLKLRQKKLELSEIHLYDMYVSLFNEIDVDYEFSTAKDLVIDSLAILGTDYQDNVKKAFKERWIDIYPNKGKRGGAYSGGAYTTAPFMLLNYTKKLNDIFTLTHEMGHSMHSLYTNQNQTYQNSHYKIFVAEIASIVNEMLLLNHLLSNPKITKDERAYLINYNLDQFRGTVFRQTMFAEFEDITNEKFFNQEKIGSQELNEIYLELNKNYFGPNVVVGDEIKYEWSRIPHFYMNFYVYQYATSYCIAIKVASEIINNNTQMIEKYQEFLKTGDSVDPITLVSKLGIDITKANVIGDALNYFETRLNELEELI